MHNTLTHRAIKGAVVGLVLFFGVFGMQTRSAQAAEKLQKTPIIKTEGTEKIVDSLTQTIVALEKLKKTLQENEKISSPQKEKLVSALETDLATLRKARETLEKSSAKKTDRAEAKKQVQAIKERLKKQHLPSIKLLIDMETFGHGTLEDLKIRAENAKKVLQAEKTDTTTTEEKQKTLLTIQSEIVALQQSFQKTQTSFEAAELNPKNSNAFGVELKKYKAEAKLLYNKLRQVLKSEAKKKS